MSPKKWSGLRINIFEFSARPSRKFLWRFEVEDAQSSNMKAKKMELLKGDGGLNISPFYLDRVFGGIL